MYLSDKMMLNFIFVRIIPSGACAWERQNNFMSVGHTHLATLLDLVYVLSTYNMDLDIQVCFRQLYTPSCVTRALITARESRLIIING